ncbi:T9SS type A sorting domain-containing protein [uncultured Cyclobacterium sp.]|uniref:T9SS type A sorting domain-containing protein n=1 Tax=uncultured Cyclobacterium sp. TaxID=453820 RepID=UPI0030EB429F|tara:strand:- start:8105 stop:9940 length:1836 start_codon:yes stop_codon:yes gene_type:complete
MNKLGGSVLICVLLFGLYSSPNCRAQFRQLPIASTPVPEKLSNSNVNLKTTEDALKLPFWDDFSSGSYSPLLWESEGVNASYTIGISPPTLGVVVLDGVDENGQPYSATRLEQGEGDQLTSKPIDLSQSTVKNDVFLSFFWQAGGKGERPDASDALELYFLEPDGSWELVWSQEGEGDLSTEVFVQALLPVPEKFQFENFQFKFQHSGRLSGPFDTWVLDYIYLNKGRSATDRFPEDRALTQLPGSPFSPYFAIPYFEFDQKKIAGPISNEFNNLNNRFRAIEYTVNLINNATGEVLEAPNTETPFNPVPQALERRAFTSSDLQEEGLVGLIDAPMDVEVLMYLRAGDTYLEAGAGEAQSFNVDYRVNDTSRVVIPFRDYYAYDNGTADYAAGINQRGGMLALSYELSTPSYLSGVSIQFVNAAQRNNAIELMVWDSISNEPLYQEEVLIPADAGIGNISYFPLDTNILVKDHFFIGFTQFSNDYIYIGLDKSGDTGDKIFFNVLGAWQQNELVRGNLMMRPHLSLNPVVEAPEQPAIELLLYPNPVTEKLYITGEVSDITVFDFQGRLINIPQEVDKEGKMLNFTESQKGMYLINMVKNGQPLTRRIIVK